MKPITTLICILLAAVSITACKSEEERRMARMVDSLDSTWAIHEASVATFFSSVDAMKAAVKPERILGAGEEAQLQGEAAEVWAQVADQHYGSLIAGSSGKLSTEKPLVLGQNACSVFYNDSLWKVHSMGFFRTWQGLPALHLDHLHHRLHEEEWAGLFYDERSISIDGEDRDDFLRKGLRLIPLLKDFQYLLVMQPVLVIPGRDTGGFYESGAALARVELWDIGQKKFTGHFWVKAVNSGMVTTFTVGDREEKDAVNAELLRDLDRNLQSELLGELGEVIAGAEVQGGDWD